LGRGDRYCAASDGNTASRLAEPRTPMSLDLILTHKLQSDTIPG
jgi:hypothetical protein